MIARPSDNDLAVAVGRRRQVLDDPSWTNLANALSAAGAGRYASAGQLLALAATSPADQRRPAADPPCRLVVDCLPGRTASASRHWTGLTISRHDPVIRGARATASHGSLARAARATA
jgi:hypothetical protein